MLSTKKAFHVCMDALIVLLTQQPTQHAHVWYACLRYSEVVIVGNHEAMLMATLRHAVGGERLGDRAQAALSLLCDRQPQTTTATDRGAAD